MISLAHIQVSAFEALTVKRLSSDAQKGIAAEMVQLIHGSVSERQELHDLAVPTMPGWRPGRYVGVSSYLKSWSIF